MAKRKLKGDDISRELARVIAPFLADTASFRGIRFLAEQAEKPKRKLGFLKGKGAVPAWFDEMGSLDILAMFAGKYA
ncbi:prevent-host-death protein [Erwinia sp. E602]|uniref:hypothetical protein n=1 Tax=unclassified Erwinia TaxID=2622719 RepID=UPI0006F4EDD9|nr:MULTISPECIES: hypothetical protein [unclassified Erwinia]KQN56979.1 hypothetical protein ASF13_07670 [Erwinia sp. Leaf53]QUG76612.1 prevent-host-death protein [Erwinia sp. E602]